MTDTDAVKTMLAALEEIDGEVNRDEAELALWKAGCQVLDTLGDAAGAERCDFAALLMKVSQCTCASDWGFVCYKKSSVQCL